MVNFQFTNSVTERKTFSAKQLTAKYQISNCGGARRPAPLPTPMARLATHERPLGADLNVNISRAQGSSSYKKWIIWHVNHHVRKHAILPSRNNGAGREIPRMTPSVGGSWHHYLDFRDGAHGTEFMAIDWPANLFTRSLLCEVSLFFYCRTIFVMT